MYANSYEDESDRGEGEGRERSRSEARIRLEVYFDKDPVNRSFDGRVMD